MLWRFLEKILMARGDRDSLRNRGAIFVIPRKKNFRKEE